MIGHIQIALAYLAYVLCYPFRSTAKRKEHLARLGAHCNAIWLRQTEPEFCNCHNETSLRFTVASNRRSDAQFRLNDFERYTHPSEFGYAEHLSLLRKRLALAQAEYEVADRAYYWSVRTWMRLSFNGPYCTNSTKFSGRLSDLFRLHQLETA